MIGRVIKIFSDFYYVKTNKGLIEAKLRTVLKKRGEEVYTGDTVELEQVDLLSMQAFIAKILKRINIINKPKTANISQVIIVSALKEPDLNFEQLNRYIAHSEYHGISPVLCFNKEDIDNTEELKQVVLNIYEPLGYRIIFTSALEHKGIDDLKPILKNNTSILCGSSGAGKSSLINSLLNTTKFKTHPVSEKTKKGVHTTRHCELIDIDDNSFIVDTPGFSHLKFDFLLPVNIQSLFKEFQNYTLNCKFKDCLHIDEIGCSALEIIKKTDKTRYDSYIKFVREAKEYENKISKESLKNEANIKYNKKKFITKISQKKRNTSRKTINQQIKKEEM